MAGLTNIFYPNSSPLRRARGGLILMQNIGGQSVLEVTEEKFTSQYFNNISRFGIRA